MSNSIGGILISLGLDATEYTQGLSKAEYQATKAVQAMTRQFESIGASIKSIAGLAGGAFGVHEIVAWGESIVLGGEQLRNLSIETGSSIESLSKLQNIAAVSGTSFDQLKTFVDRFTAGMAGADDQTTRVGEVMAVLGVKAKDPAQALIETAKRLNEFADGANKAALARDAFGKGGVALLASLKAIGDEQDISATKTKKQIDDAVELAESYRKLKIASHELSDAFLGEVVPALSAIVQRFADAKREGAGFLDSIQLFILSRKGFGTYAETIADLDGKIKGLQETIARTKVAGPITAAVGGLFGTLPNLDDANEQLRKLQTARGIAAQAQLRELGGGPSNERLNGLPNAPKLPPKGSAEDASRKALEAQLAELKSFAEREKALLSLRNEVASADYDQGIISLKQFGEEKKQALFDDLQNQQRNYQEEVKLLNARIAQPGLSDADRESAKKQLTEATNRYTLTAIAGAKELIRSENEQTNATREFSNSIKELNAQILDLAGNSAAAAKIRLDFQNAQQRKALVASGETGAVANLDFLTQQKVLQAGLNDEKQKYGVIIDKLGIAQSALDIEAQRGSLSEIDLLNKRADIARQYIPILQAQADAQQKLAEALAPGIEREKALLDVQKLRLGIEQLGVTADGLKIKLDGVFTDNFTTALDSIVNGTKSVSAAFKDMGKSIASTITHMVNEQIAKQLFNALFGTGGATNGVSPGGLLSSLFGGGGAGAGVGGLLGSLFGGNNAGGGYGMNDRGTGSSGGGGLGGLGGLFGLFGGGGGAGPVGGFSDLQMSILDNVPGFGLPGFAGGTNFAPGGMAMVGERGPELMHVPRGAQIIPNHELMARRASKSLTQNFYTNVMPGASTASGSQAALAQGREVSLRTKRLA